MDAPGEKTEVVLDISADVSTEGEGGLLSLAHSPEGDEIFVTYSGRDKKAPSGRLRARRVGG